MQLLFTCTLSSDLGLQRIKQVFGFNPKTGTDLKNEVKRLMFSSDKEKEPFVVSNDEARFEMVMSAFTNYEKQVNMNLPVAHAPDITHFWLP